MQKISAPIRTCIAGASALLESGYKLQAEALYKITYDVCGNLKVGHFFGNGSRNGGRLAKST